MPTIRELTQHVFRSDAKRLSLTVRYVGVGCGIVAALAACSRGPTQHAASSAPPSVPDVKSLIVGIEAVSRISGVDDLTSAPPSDQPTQFPLRDMPEPCQPAYHEDVAFDGGWKQFRSVAYSTQSDTGTGQARALLDSIQAAGVYPDANSARARFDGVVSALSRCESLHDERYPFTVDRKDPSTLAVDTGQWKIVFQLKSAVLMEVGAIGFPDSARVASDVIQAMAERIT